MVCVSFVFVCLTCLVWCGQAEAPAILLCIHSEHPERLWPENMEGKHKTNLAVQTQYGEQLLWMSHVWTCAHTWPVEMDAPLRRARMSPDRCSILTTLTGTSNFLTYLSNCCLRKSNKCIYKQIRMQSRRLQNKSWITSCSSNPLHL